MAIPNTVTEIFQEFEAERLQKVRSEWQPQELRVAWRRHLDLEAKRQKRDRRAALVAVAVCLVLTVATSMWLGAVLFGR